MFRVLVGALSGVCAIALCGCQTHTAASQASGGGPSLEAARQALSEGEAGTALAIARGVLSSQPNNVAALTQAGDAQTALGDRLAAQASYRRALAISPHDVRARLGQGKLQIRDNLPAAEATFRAILADAPHSPVVLTDLGYVLDLQEHHAEAQRLYEEAIAIDPNRLSPRVDLALSLALSGQGARAEQMLRDIAASSAATPKVRVDFALAQVIAGHDQDAARTLAADMNPAETKSALEGLEQFKP
jgi:Flp pilus assembly protein TadD